MRRLMMEMKPTRFDHIIAAISLYRPGPMDNIPEYVRRMHGVTKVEYHHPDLEPILAGHLWYSRLPGADHPHCRRAGGLRPRRGGYDPQGGRQEEAQADGTAPLKFTEGAMANGYSPRSATLSGAISSSSRATALTRRTPPITR
jgi:hypothetical protein